MYTLQRHISGCQHRNFRTEQHLLKFFSTCLQPLSKRIPAALYDVNKVVQVAVLPHVNVRVMTSILRAYRLDRCASAQTPVTTADVTAHGIEALVLFASLSITPQLLYWIQKHGVFARMS